MNKYLYDHGSEYVEGVNAISGERCSPHPHVFSDRMLRPGDPVYYDILHSYMGYRTCYYRTFAIGSASHAMIDAYKRCRDYLDAAIELVRPGRTTAEIASVWPKAQEFGFPNEEAAFALQIGHGIGLAIWEKPVISRLVSLEHSYEIKPGMVFALETFWPTKDGWSAARIEEEIVVTETGARSHHALPGREAARRRRAVRHRRRAARDDTRARAGAQSGRRQHDRGRPRGPRLAPGSLSRFRSAGRRRDDWSRCPKSGRCPGKGLEGDRYFRGEGQLLEESGGGRQVTLVASEMLNCSNASTASRWRRPRRGGIS